MDGQAAARQVDELVAPFLKATDEAESAWLLAQLIGEHALPVINEVTRSKLRAAPRQDAEDIASEVVLQLVRKLGQLKSNSPSQFPNFRGYVAVVAYNACYQYLRDKRPGRSRLKYKIRYVLTRQKGFSMWEGEDHKWYCGFATWQDQEKTSRPGRLHSLRNSLQTLPASGTSGRDLAELLAAIFDWAGAPVELDPLVDTVADIWQVVDRVEADEERIQSLVHDTASVADVVERRLFLQRLWIEIRELPLNQRRALLLNLRDEQGHDVTSLLPPSRIASMREIAQALAMSAEEFARLWSHLPLDDTAIAKSLGVTRQQVINLRSAARKRLSRRLQR